MPDVPFALALAAGMVAAVNPCGFALLPAYLSLLVVGQTPGRFAALGRALTDRRWWVPGAVTRWGAAAPTV